MPAESVRITESEWDPVIPRYVPDRTLVARAQRHMMASETERRRYLRQRWEEAFGAVRVAMDTLRLISPIDHDLLGSPDDSRLDEALGYTQAAYIALDSLSRGILGPVMHGVLTGEISTHERLDQFEVPK